MPPPARKPGPQRSELAEALSACRGTFIAVALMSGMSNILQLTGAFFMLEVYDRVLPSRSVPTLVGPCDLGRRPVHGTGPARHDPRPHPGADRWAARRGAERTRLRDHRASAVEGGQPRRQPSAAARPRQRALVPVGHGSRGAVRPAVASDLSVHLLHVPSLYRARRADRRDHPRRADLGHRDDDARQDARSDHARGRRGTRSPTRAAATPRC